LTYALPPKARAKPRQQTGFFDRISIRLKDLYVIRARVSGLRQRCDKPKANWWHPVLRLTPHAAASGFLRGGGMASDSVGAATDAIKLRKIFRRDATLRQRLVGHAHKSNDVPKMAADRATL
jgi:hypothetical protein